MRTRILLGVGLVLLGLVANVRSQEVVWRAAKPVTLGMPKALAGAPDQTAPPRVVRMQVGEPPPPPVFPGGGGGPSVFPTPGVGGPDAYNKGVVNNDSDMGGFWTRTGDRFKRCWDDITGGASGALQSSPRRAMFQSDPDFDYFSSPTTNPFFFEDPRSLTEVRPFFIWQRTPGANPVWNGGDNFHYGVRGSVAITENISVVVSRLGFTSISPNGGAPGISSSTGFSELLIGPKLTFLRSETSRTVAAVGVTFDISSGAPSVLQDTGSGSIVPYFSIAQNFGRINAGSFNFMNTTGYAFRLDNTRTPSFYSSFHLDFDWGDTHRIYPFLELNWRYYARNGAARPLNFEGNDLGNFGSGSVAGLNELTLALGTRIKINTCMWWGIGAEFNVLKNGDGRHLDRFRLTTDFIFRY